MAGPITRIPNEVVQEIAYLQHAAWCRLALAASELPALVEEFHALVQPVEQARLASAASHLEQEQPGNPEPSSRLLDLIGIMTTFMIIGPSFLELARYIHEEESWYNWDSSTRSDLSCQLSLCSALNGLTWSAPDEVLIRRPRNISWWPSAWTRQLVSDHMSSASRRRRDLIKVGEHLPSGPILARWLYDAIEMNGEDIDEGDWIIRLMGLPAPEGDDEGSSAAETGPAGEDDVQAPAPSPAADVPTRTANVLEGTIRGMTFRTRVDQERRVVFFDSGERPNTFVEEPLRVHGFIPIGPGDGGRHGAVVSPGL
ncbi:hypothetical protein QBC34DRAFT_424027 [Podospora aff. communis PSN243]|uniref:Uncharacterized protein n=1 Tax=Podospora aff. communis PSN243 TaxID=3040156 RepID=A0AAV9GRY5_9PEZI|nr:hypothetical protein QBC34DRAFT_424027 [Podospora aff. communis PSN243]